MSSWTSCTWCKIGLTVGLAAIFSIGGGVAAAVVGGVVWIGAVIGALIGAGIALSELGDLVCCEAGAKDCCPRGSTQFWRKFGMAIQRNSGGGLTQADCKSLNNIIDELLLNGQIDAAKAATLRAALAKHCG